MKQGKSGKNTPDGGGERNIGNSLRCIIQSHGGHNCQVMGLPPISWTHALPYLITKILVDGTHN